MCSIKGRCLCSAQVRSSYLESEPRGLGAAPDAGARGAEGRPPAAPPTPAANEPRERAGSEVGVFTSELRPTSDARIKS